MALRTEQSTRVDEAETRCRELQVALNEQRVAYDMLVVSASGSSSR